MDRRLFFLACCLFTMNFVSSDGPVFVNPSSVTLPPAVNQGNYVTQTVYGFLDFTTTIGNTVMVFSPQSAAVSESPKVESSNTVIDTSPIAKKETVIIKPSKTEVKIISSKVEVKTLSQDKPSTKVSPSIVTKVEVVSGPPVISSKVEIVTSSEKAISSVVSVKTEEEPAVILGNNIAEPEYDFLSRQPSEVVEETYKVINLKPSSKFHLKPRTSEPKNKRPDSLHPTGLVTKLGGTVVKDGTTTIHETSVIGTYISGKYAQVLQSTSHIHNPQKAKISPSPTLRILKTAAPSLGKSKHHRHLEPTPAGSIEETIVAAESSNSIKSTRKPAGPTFKPRFKNRQKEEEEESEEVQHTKKKSQRTRNQGRISNEEATTSSNKRYQNRRKQQRTSTESSGSGGYSRRGYKPKVQTSTVEQTSASTSLYKFKLNRSPGRWQYKTTPKPRVTIRKQNDDNDASNETLGTTPTTLQDVSPALNDVVTPQARSDDVDGLEESESIASIIDDQSSTENKLDTPFPLETLKVEISTPPDFKDIYYEIATIKSPFTFQAGNVKNTRYITVTSTFEKSLVNTPEATISPSGSEPLTENILATSSNYKDNNFFDSSVATLPPIYLASDMQTPPLETLTETFSTTQTMLKTHILPVIHSGNETATSTLVQTYLITRLVTATKTLPPMEAYHFIPSKTLKEFNSHLDEAGSELHLELEFGDQNDQEDEGQLKRSFPQDLDLAKIGSDFDISDVDKSKLPEIQKVKTGKSKPVLSEPQQTPALNPDQLQQLALLRLLNPAAAQGQVITTSKPVFKIETVYESHIIPIVNGGNTVLSTISKVLGTITKTDFEFGTSTLAPPALPIPPIPPVNPLFPAAQFAVTSSPVVQSTLVTQTDSKVLKLTFGAKTAYTTIFSTKVVPSLVTTYMTASVPVQPTAFPGFFPAPYPGYPFVG
ncbi:uncharacterized protein LOC123005317 isoform X2 [Tribolium madens]|uniref:uncharacterized protein LOC123005317 isoform X2 n=1 Tax=Tribolium madens TaxID=41895 RepID=UPI001CF75E77|nr:uncharacterized protein LOC123005317 isoform X2 [Tribolium madens]